MEEYLKRHEAWINGLLASAAEGFDWSGLAQFHKTQIAWMQHERLIHLLVTLFFGLFALLAVLFTVAVPRLEMAALIAFLLLLLIPYVAHYFRLENGVQRWYHLANEIERRAGRVSADHRRPTRPGDTQGAQVTR
jgi:cell division protein FtsW (lipid II flippase)